MRAVWLITLFCLAHARDKLCGNSIIPFSGFKVIRQYRISMSGLKPLSQEFVSLVHCDHGKVDYKTVLKVESITQIDWQKTMCIYKPRVASYENNIEGVASHSIERGIRINNSTMAAKKLSKPEKGLTRYLKDVFDRTLEYITSKRAVVYTGRKTNKHIEDIESSTLEAAMQWESRNLACYKLARRKQYSRSNISFFVPQTFVGGLYECIIPSSTLAEIFQTSKLPQSNYVFDVECDPLLSRPLLPLIADISANQWWDIKYNIFSPSATQFIPYLTTPEPTNLRFGIHKTPELQGWAERIHVNEAYDFTDFEPHILSQAISSTADLIFKALKPVDFGKLLKEQVNYQVAGHPISESDLVINTIKQLSVDQKLGLLLSIDPPKYQKVIEKIQGIWDKLVRTQIIHSLNEPIS